MSATALSVTAICIVCSAWLGSVFFRCSWHPILMVIATAQLCMQSPVYGGSLSEYRDEIIFTGASPVESFSHQKLMNYISLNRIYRDPLLASFRLELLGRFHRITPRLNSYFVSKIHTLLSSFGTNSEPLNEKRRDRSQDTADNDANKGFAHGFVIGFCTLGLSFMWGCAILGAWEEWGPRKHRDFNLPNVTDEPRPQLARAVRQHGS